MINRFLPLILLLGILLNFACVVVFRLKLDRRNDLRYDDFSKLIDSRLSEMSVEALSKIDLYFVSNYVNHSSFSDLDNISLKSPVLDTVAEWHYNYFELGDKSYANVGSRQYTVGDKFPRGGFITAIYPDGIELDNRYWVLNLRNNQQIKIGDNYDSRSNISVK